MKNPHLQLDVQHVRPLLDLGSCQFGHHDGVLTHYWHDSGGLRGVDLGWPHHAQVACK